MNQKYKILINRLKQTRKDRKEFFFNKQSFKCANASLECEDTGVTCFLLGKSCDNPKFCEHWRCSKNFK